MNEKDEQIEYLQSKNDKLEREKKEQHDLQTTMVIVFGSLLAAGVISNFDPMATGLFMWPIMGAVYLVKALWK